MGRGSRKDLHGKLGVVVGGVEGWKLVGAGLAGWVTEDRQVGGRMERTG